MSRSVLIPRVAVQPLISVMGLNHKAYRLRDIERIMTHYNRKYSHRLTRVAAVAQLQRLEQVLGFTREDRLRILRPFREADRVVTQRTTAQRIKLQRADAQRAAAIRPSSPVEAQKEGSGRIAEEQLQAMVMDIVTKPLNWALCSICMENLSVDLFPRRGIADAYSHAPTACLTPVHSGRLQVQFQVRRHSCLTIMHGYDTLSTVEAMSDMPNFRLCLAPGCDSGQDHELGAAETIMTCNECGRRICFIHEMEWHADVTCKAMDQKLADTRRVENDASEELLTQKTKRCPNEHCGRRVKKNRGMSTYDLWVANLNNALNASINTAGIVSSPGKQSDDKATTATQRPALGTRSTSQIILWMPPDSLVHRKAPEMSINASAHSTEYAVPAMEHDESEK
ncbi:MAG: hypothetical protein M1830_001755 [Pleopsidium flavum]|nr:MAG: hypothetical protein M1830_001755 [Pleopsidium flavum]